MHRLLNWIVIAAGGLGLSSYAAAQTCVQGAPPGSADFCSTPYIVPGTPGHHEILMDAATATGTQQMCGGSSPAGHTIWFSVTPSVDGPVTISTCHPSTMYDTTLDVYTGGDAACNGMTLIACNDDASGAACDNGCSFFGSTVTFHGFASQTYRFLVGSYDGNLVGCTPMCLGVFVTIGEPCGDAPINTTPDTAIALAAPGGGCDITQDLTNSTGGTWTPSCATQPMGPTVWYRITPTWSGTLYATTCHPNTSFDTVMTIIEGDPLGISAEIACNDDAFDSECFTSCIPEFGRASRVQAPVTAGQTYYIAVGAYNQNSEGCPTLCLGLSVRLEYCPSDTNGDGLIDINDLLKLLADWGACP